MDSVTRFFYSVFFMNHLPPNPENKIRIISNFFEFAEIFASEGSPPVANLPPVSTTPVANNGSNIRLLTSESKLERKIYLYVNSTTQRCPKKIIKTFLIEDFFHLPPVSTTLVVYLELRISPRIWKNSKRPYWYTQGLGVNWFIKKPEVENLEALFIKQQLI
jgi:hypothetical protein